ncbi:MAG: hypothetical protein QXN59_01065 [Candidatus Micrarchaeaceae archaeon]
MAENAIYGYAVNARGRLLRVSKGDITIEDYVAVSISEKNKFKFESNFEATVAVALNLFGIGFQYCQTQFPIQCNGKEISYTPDFILSMQKNGKTVILEPHGSNYIDKKFIGKMSLFMESNFAKSYYVVLFTDVSPRHSNRLFSELSKEGMGLKDICNEAWFLPYRHEAEDSAKGYKTNVYSLLRKFINDEPIACHEHSRIIP